MNKNAAIIEGNITKKLNPVSKVKVSNSDTGESTWVPEESKTTHSLSVIKNGIYYAASEGYTAYDTVTVNVSSETEVNYEGIIADMPDLADLGLYDLDDLEGLDGLDLDLDEMLDLENLILDGDLEEGELPDSGATIKGIDPDSGETLEVGLDQDGNLMEQALPDHIHIVVWPRKRHYLEGEIIDFSGIHVYLMKKGTERFTCEQYPTGEIPFDELVFPVTIAEGESGHGKSTLDGKTVEYSNHVLWQYQYHGRDYTDYGDAISSDFLFTDGNLLYAVSETSGVGERSKELWTDSIGHSFDWTNFYDQGTRQIKGKIYYYAYCNHTYHSSGMDYWNGTLSITDIVTSIDDIIDIIFNGVHSDRQEIPVQWIRSDGETLEDTFPIEIVSEEEPVPEPEPDPYADVCDFIWEGKKYCFNKSLARSEVMYSNGTVWQTWLGGQSPPYTVDQALKLKLIVQVGWSGGGSTSGGF